MTLARTAQTAREQSPQTASVQTPQTARAQSGEDDPETDGPGPDVERPAGRADLVPAIVRRRLAPLDARLDPWSWLATGVVVAIAAILRLVGLSHPEGKIFDEIYYARDAWGLLDHGVEWNYKDDTASYVVHPPLGKWLIALGEWAFGYSDAEHGIDAGGHIATLAPEIGWRISAAIIGTLSVLVLVRVARRLFGSTVLGCAAGLLLALDGFHLVLSRSALLDIFLMFFVLAAFGALVLDRDARRRRWLRAMEGGLDPSRPGRAGRPTVNRVHPVPGRSTAGFAALRSLAAGLRDWVPWWRLLSAVLLGCAASVKWSALAFAPVFVLLVVWWEVGARRSAGVRRPWLDTFLDETGWVVLAGVLVVATYLASWSGWLLTDDGYYRHYLADTGTPEPPILGPLQNLIKYHETAFDFHQGLQTAHTYQSWPWQWLLLGRPVAFHWSTGGTCGASNCASEVLLLGTPILWWSFLPALAAATWLGIARRDWRAGAILLFAGAALLPWFWFALDGRTMFSFYAAPALPFLILAVVYVLGAIMSPAPATAATARVTIGGFDRRTVGAIIAGTYVLAVGVCFAYFYPIFVGQVIPYDDWWARMWLGGRWV